MIIEYFPDSEEVDRAVADEEIEHRCIDESESWIVEILRNEETAYLHHRFHINEDRTEYTTFRFDAMRRGFEIHEVKR